MSDNGQRRRHKPPALGGFEFRRDGDRWKLYQGDRLICRGLSRDQMLAIIRGEVRVAEVAHGKA